ncbi:hypothetical protein HDU96_005012 [Phlyctochytrium bullatum]|nr:hypothetical protein HDU96_005012 [Phlyctochytrium bullatum]
MNGPEDGNGPAVIPIYVASDGQVVLRLPEGEETKWDLKTLKRQCRTVFIEAGEANDIQPHRLIYAMAGRIFIVQAPKPIGGKPSPGFKKFDGETPDDVLSWILDKAVEPPLSGRGRKKVPPATILRFVVEHLNLVLEMKRNGEKDAMDDTVLKGMFRSGHLADNAGKIVLPAYLRDRSVIAEAKNKRPASPSKSSAYTTKKKREDLVSPTELSGNGEDESQSDERSVHDNSESIQAISHQPQGYNHPHSDAIPPTGPYGASYPYPAPYPMRFPPHNAPFPPFYGYPPHKGYPYPPPTGPPFPTGRPGSSNPGDISPSAARFPGFPPYSEDHRGPIVDGVSAFLGPAVDGMSAFLGRPDGAAQGMAQTNLTEEAIAAAARDSEEKT